MELCWCCRSCAEIVCDCTQCLVQIVASFVAGILWIAYIAVMISSTLVTANDEKLLKTDEGELYYKTLPIVSCVIPNPIGPYLSANNGECTKKASTSTNGFDIIAQLCENSLWFIEQFNVAFYLGIFIWVCWFGVAILFCFGKRCLKGASKCCDYTLCCGN